MDNKSSIDANIIDKLLIELLEKKGLTKAVVYEAVYRARELGAKCAIVLLQQDFYYKIGFKVSSEFAY